LINRVALSAPVAVIGMNGYAMTAIEGQWDPASTNGPGAIRCAWLTNGAVLSGFTLRNGATRGGSFITFELQYGGGAWLSTNAIVSNCAFTNNNADYGGGGVAFGTVNNSFLTHNTAQYGGGAYQVLLNNCTIIQNNCVQLSSGAVHLCIVRNCVVLYNSNEFVPFQNYFSSSFTNSCTHPKPLGTANIDTNVVFTDSAFHLPAVSPCRGAGSFLYAAGADLDGELWANPPSMGCDEIIDSNFVGPLTVFIRPRYGDALVNDSYELSSTVNGRPSRLSWSLGDGSCATNASDYINHIWTNAGNYTVTFTAYNLDNPAGVSTNFLVVVDPINSPLLESTGVTSNSFQFTFPTQTNAIYTVQYATNLVAPVAWQTLKIFFGPGGVVNVNDPLGTNAIRFYQVQAK
jgi:hypothetical protein